MDKKLQSTICHRDIPADPKTPEMARALHSCMYACAVTVQSGRDIQKYLQPDMRSDFIGFVQPDIYSSGTGNMHDNHGNNAAAR